MINLIKRSLRHSHIKYVPKQLASSTSLSSSWNISSLRDNDDVTKRQQQKLV